VTTLLVANRGEIARRIFRTAKRLGLRTVAVHSDADAGLPYVREADAAVRLGPGPARESYLDVTRVIAAAAETGADLIHPGYGFLAESTALATAVAKAGRTFVGPPPDVLAALGDKANAKEIARKAGVPILPGFYGDDQRDEAFIEAASRKAPSSRTRCMPMPPPPAIGLTITGKPMRRAASMNGSSR
jgi:acetyl/propionyl-CoA carboxylase alpha subunit